MLYAVYYLINSKVFLHKNRHLKLVKCQNHKLQNWTAKSSLKSYLAEFPILQHEESSYTHSTWKCLAIDPTTILLHNLAAMVRHFQTFISCLPSYKETIDSGSKNKSITSSPNHKKTAALTSFWQPHFDINRKFTAVSLLTMENKCTPFWWHKSSLIIPLFPIHDSRLLLEILLLFSAFAEP